MRLQSSEFRNSCDGKEWRAGYTYPVRLKALASHVCSFGREIEVVRVGSRSYFVLNLKDSIGVR